MAQRSVKLREATVDGGGKLQKVPAMVFSGVSRVCATINEKAMFRGMPSFPRCIPSHVRKLGLLFEKFPEYKKPLHVPIRKLEVLT